MTPPTLAPRRTVVIAPDSFKSSLSASAVAAEIAAGWREILPGDELVLVPQADGGEGTLDAIELSIAGARRRDAGEVTGPDGRPTRGQWLLLPDGTAVVELAQCSGLPLMRLPDACGASTRGLGEVIGHALDAGAQKLLIGLGGSASTDAGAGALCALGLRLFDSAGRALADGGGALNQLSRADRSKMRPPPPGGVFLLTDVVSVLYGQSGAALTFAPQKGASSAEVLLLDSGLRRFSQTLETPIDPETPGAGAAGGTAWGFAALWDAGIIPGAEFLAQLSGLPRALTRAQLIITGEGRFDESSLHGKVVGNVLTLAQRHAVPVALIAGQIAFNTGQIKRASPATALSLSQLAGSVEEALANPRPYLKMAARMLAQQQKLV